MQKRALIISQIGVILGLTSFGLMIALPQFYIPVVQTVSSITSGLMFTLGSLVIFWSSVKTSTRVQASYVDASSSFTPFFKFFLSGLVISFALLMLQLAFISDAKFFGILLIFLVVASFPVYVMIMAVRVVVSEEQEKIILYDYYGGNHLLNASQVISINRMLFGPDYQLKYRREDGRESTVYFYPRGGIFASSSLHLLKRLVPGAFE